MTPYPSLILSMSLSFLVGCSTQPSLWQSSNEGGLLLLEAHANHGEKLWYADGVRVKSEQWDHGLKHGMAVEMDSSMNECVVYTRFHQGQEAGTDLSDNCTQSISNLAVQRSFESDDQLMLNYDGIFNEWVISLKKQSESQIKPSIWEDHAFEMGLRLGVKGQVQSFLNMDVDKPEWHRMLKRFDVNSFQLGADRASLEFPHEFPLAQSGQAFRHKVKKLMDKAGYPSGSDVNAFAWGILLGEYSARKVMGSALLTKKAWKKANLYQVQLYKSMMRGTDRLSKRGEWTGRPGNSYWLSYREDILRLTQGDGVLFYNGMPAVSPWSQIGILLTQDSDVISAELKLLSAVEQRYHWDGPTLAAHSQSQQLSLVSLGQGRFELIPDLLKQEIQFLKQNLKQDEQ